MSFLSCSELHGLAAPVRRGGRGEAASSVFTSRAAMVPQPRWCPGGRHLELDTRQPLKGGCCRV
jgi:hypothetical protein